MEVRALCEMKPKDSFLTYDTAILCLHRSSLLSRFSIPYPTFRNRASISAPKISSPQAEWLAQSGTPLCVLSATPLSDPPPAYRPPPTDAVLAWREARYGPRGWQLPPVAAPHPDQAERCAVFAAALLEGRVLPALAGERNGVVSEQLLLTADRCIPV